MTGSTGGAVQVVIGAGTAAAGVAMAAVGTAWLHGAAEGPSGTIATASVLVVGVCMLPALGAVLAGRGLVHLLPPSHRFGRPASLGLLAIGSALGLGVLASTGVRSLVPSFALLWISACVSSAFLLRRHE